MSAPDTITHVPHAAIDKARWDEAIARAAHPLVYAQSSWLDAMSPGWDALLLGDYEAVMPLTWRSKMGIRYLCQPAFTQQLGVFATTSLKPEQVDAFLRKTAVSYRLVEIYLNHASQPTAPASQHINLVLPLDANYAGLSAAYKKDLWKNLDRSAKFNLQYQTDLRLEEAVSLYQAQYGNRIGFRPEDYTRFLQLAQELASRGQAFTRQVTMPDGSLLAIGLFVKDHQRMYNLASTTLPNGRTLEANHVLFDRLIAEFAGSGMLLDFEGSDQPGIARFYQKFGSRPQPYWFWKLNRLPAVMRWWKR